MRTRSPQLPAFLLTAVVTVVAAAPAAAQRLAILDPIATGGPGVLELIAPNPLLPPGSPPVLIYPEAPALPPPPAFVVPPGDSTFDGVTGLHWRTNGFLLSAMPTPDFPPAAPPVPPVPVPPAVIAAIGGPVTGLAITPGGPAGPPILYVVSAPGIVLGIVAAPPFAVAVPPFPLPFVAGVPVTGLEADAMTGTLLAVTAPGLVFPFFPGGALAGPVLVPPLPLPGIASDVAIDKTGGVNAAAVRAVYVLAGPMVFDVTFPAPPLPAGTPAASGLAFVPHPASNPPLGVCPCATFPAYGLFTTGPMTAGNLGFGIGIGGLPPGQIALFAFDFAFDPTFPAVNTVGCGLGLVLPAAASGAAFANAAGLATYALPLAVLPGTGPVFALGATLCPADPRGFVLTPTLHLAACGT